jgi:hypothetical protein
MSFGGGGTNRTVQQRTIRPVAERTPEQTRSAEERQRFRFFGSGGRMSTMLTSGGGAGQGSAAVRYLGGAART